MLIEKNDKLIITQNPTGNFLYILLAFIMTAIPVAALLFADDLDNFHFVIFILAAFFFGLALIFLVFRTIVNKDIIVVDKNGITDNSTAIALGFIPWDNIANIKIDTVEYQGGTQQFISVILIDEEAALSNVSPLKKPIILANMKLGFSPVNFSLTTTGIPIEEFYEKLVAYQNNL